MINFEGGAIPAGVSHRLHRRSREHDRHGLARPDRRLHAVPRPQVRPDHAERVLSALRLLQQRARERPRRPQGQRRAAAELADAAAAGRARRAGRRRSRRSKPRSPRPKRRKDAPPDAEAVKKLKDELAALRKRQTRRCEAAVANSMVMQEMPQPRDTFVLRPRGVRQAGREGHGRRAGVPAAAARRTRRTTGWAWRSGWSTPSIR